MPEFEVWSEGCHQEDGSFSGPTFHGKIQAEDFDSACIRLLGNKLEKNKDGSYRRGVLIKPMNPGIERTRAIEKGGNYVLGWSQLFPTEEEARR